MAYRGVIETKDGRFEARIFKDAKESRIGVYDSAVDAAIAYDLTADAAMGEYAALNFPELSDRETLDILPQGE